MSLRHQLLWKLDKIFPPDPTAYLSAEQQTEHEIEKAADSMADYLSLVSRTDIDVLDFGCGWGGETLWLAQRVRSATGGDVEASSVEEASRALSASGVRNCRFVHSPNGQLPFADGSFDAVFSTNTMEHVMDLKRAFAEILRVLKPGAPFVSRFGPLFYSPHGY